MVSPINPIYANIVTSRTYTVVINAFLGQKPTTIGPHQHQAWDSTIVHALKSLESMVEPEVNPTPSHCIQTLIVRSPPSVVLKLQLLL